MRQNFFRLFLRNFLKFGLLNSINIIGLSLGFVASFLIVLYVDHEFSYDEFHSNADQIYRLEAKRNSDQWFANLGTEHARELLKGTYPEVEKLVRVNNSPRAFISIKGEKFSEEKVYYTTVESKFFELFDFDFLEGSRDIALKNPYSVVLTQSSAQKYFADQSPLGRTLSYDSVLLTVSGVIKDLPTHTNFDFSMIYTNPARYNGEHFHTKTYIQLFNNSNPETLSHKVLDMDVAYNEFHTLSEVRLMPVKDIHLSSDIAFGDGGKGDTLQISVFMVLAILILSIAVINYINLTFAIFLNKGKEVGIRKVLGESKTQIIIRLAKYSILTTLLAIPLIVLGLYFFVPFFGQFMEVDLMNIIISKPFYLIIYLGLLIVTGLLSIVYPTLALGQIDAGKLIKSGLLLTQSGGVHYRNLLILVQFIFLFTLGISAWFMNRQIQFLDDKDKGFNPKNVVKVGNAFEIGSYDNYKVIKNQLLSYPQISGVSFGPVMGDGMSPLAYKPEGSDEIYENLLSYGVDIDYFDVMEIDIPIGDFKRILNSSEDGHIVSLVNESFINRYGWSDDPLGKKIILRPQTENELHRQVSAVFNDFHFFSFKEKITPQIISLRPDPTFVNTNLLIKSTTDDIQETMRLVDQEWSKMQPDLPITMTLMSDAVQRMYAKEKQTSKVGVFLSLLAVVLSISGIVGFMFYILSLKSKEIAIRKVMGASISQIIALLNRQLFFTILIAGILGSLSSYWLINKWLQDYAYSIKIGPATFISAVILIYVGVFVIVGFQTLKSTYINPAVVLKEK